MMATWDRLISAFCYWLCSRFPARARVIPHAEDPTTPLLVQLILWPHHLYLQHFLTPESLEWYHRHRWAKMWSLVLSGWFVEHRPIEDRYVGHRRGNIYRMDKYTIHRVVHWSPWCWTLFWVRGASDDWGYYPRSAFAKHAHPGTRLSYPFVPWRQHVLQRVPNIETGKVTK